MPQEPATAAAPEGAEADLSLTYLLVILVEVAVIAALYGISRYFS